MANKTFKWTNIELAMIARYRTYKTIYDTNNDGHDADFAATAMTVIRRCAYEGMSQQRYQAFLTACDKA